MFEQLNFYVRHSLNDLRVNGQRTFFAILCIAAGVAAIVSLQTVAGMIGDTLTGNLQETNRGDMQVTMFDGFVDEADDTLNAGVASGFIQESEFSGSFGPPRGVKSFSITLEGVQQLERWIQTNYPGQIDMTYQLQTANIVEIFTSSGIGTSVTDTTSGEDATSVSPILINPQQYPFYGEVKSLDGKLLKDLIQAPTDIVIDQKVAEALKASVGDTVQLGGSQTEFTVRGIVPTEAEVTDPFTGIFAALFGFYYLDNQAVALFEDLKPTVSTIYLRLQDPAAVSEINNALLSAYPFLRTTTIEDLKISNEEISGQINQLVTVMGLVSLLLGSIGIINTMQVIVRRRTVEVAVLKTLGLQGGQVTILFLVEAFIMGIVGSLAGIVLGWLTTFVIKGVAENLVAQPLTFRIIPLAAVNGFVVGTLVTTIFGFLPTLAAGQVRPGIVLRPTDDIIPRAGCLRTVLALLVIIIALSLVTQTIIGSFGLALAVTVGAFFGAGILFGLLSLLIWLVGRFFPSLGSIDLKISLRQMLASRSRAAVTLLALVVGVFALSLITLFADSINQLLDYALGQGAGGNVLVSAAIPSSLQRVEPILQSLDGVESYQIIYSYSGTFVSLEKSDGTILNTDQIKAQILTNVSRRPFGPPRDADFDAGQFYLDQIGQVDGRRLDQLPSANIQQGRALNADDAGKAVMVIQANPTITAIGLEVGDKITYQYGEAADAPRVTFEIVGVVPSNFGGIGGRPLYAPVDAFPAGVQPQNITTLVNIADEQIPELRAQVGKIPGTFVLETSIFTKLLTSLLGTFTAFPTMVALLGLIVGGVVIANSVALATLERRREIAVMKAVGLQRERVLGMLLLENGVLGLIGGLIGVGIGLVVLVILLAASNTPSQVIPYGSALILMGLCILVALVAATTTAWNASGEKPLNVLRYE